MSTDPGDGAGTGPTILAAGAVAWRSGADGREVVLVHRPKYDDWSLPKGKLDAGEHPLVAAVREVREETGFEVSLGRPLPDQVYLADGRRKQVRYWAAATRGGSFTAGAEVDEIAWLEPKAARDRLTHDRDGDVLDAFADGPEDTVAVVLLRHGRAVRRGDWTADDELRPLAPTGQAQAQALAPVLACLGLARVLSSDSSRCVDSVSPFSAAARLTLETEPLFSESGFRAHRQASLARARRLRETSVSLVLCTHRPVLPQLAAAFCDGGPVSPPAATLPPGGFWVLHLAEGTVVAVDVHER